MASFNELGLSEDALGAVARLGYEAPTPVQEQAIPLALAGRDVIAAAKTGTGKTAAFSLPAMDGLPRAERGEGPLLLIVTPTRELASQIGDVCGAIATATHHRILTVVGGLSYEPQIKSLKRGVDVLIATPGRLIDLMDQGAVNLGDVRKLVLDEADRMLDMGFLPSVKKIVAATPDDRQTLLFSATIDEAVLKNVRSLLRDPAFVEIAHKGETADKIEQYIVRVPQTLKPDLLRAVLAEQGHERVIVFARTRRRADTAARRLKKAGYTVEAIHSDRSQNQRARALRNFAEGATDILVATDVLARGIDVADVDYVVNFDLPTVPEDYVHRIGRTGRAGAAGRAISFVSPETEPELRDIQKLIKRDIPVLDVPSFDVEAAAAEAAARATRASAKKDPELAAAAKELAAKERKKAKAKAARQEEAAAPKKGVGKKGKPKKAAAIVSTDGGTSAPEQHGKKRAAKSAPQPTKARTSQKPRSGAAHGKAKSAASHKAAKADLRPGRAHRAAVEKQRAAKRSGKAGGSKRS